MAKGQRRSALFREHFHPNGQTGGEARWSSADPSTLVGLITAVSETGGAVLFGHSRDGGAYQVSFFWENERTTHYLGCNEDVSGWLADFVTQWEHLASQLASEAAGTG